MRTKSFFSALAVALVAASAMVPQDVAAYSFAVGGLCYDLNGTEATVTYRNQNGGDYSGSIVIPEKVTYDGVQYAVTAIGDGAFGHCTYLTDVTIPNSIVKIGNHAFAYCTGLKSVVIPNSVTEMGRCVFHSCSSLTTAVVGNSVPVIDEYCFQYCGQLEKVTLGSSVNYLAIKAFFNCYSLVDVTCLALTPPTMYADYSFDYSVYSNATLSVMGSALRAYKTAENWGRFSKFNNLTTATHLSLDQPSLTMMDGESRQLTPVVQPADANASMNWTSSNDQVATVSSSGVVTAMGAGQATITATTLDGSNLSASCLVRVLSSGLQSSNVLLLPQSLTVEKGKECQLPVQLVNSAPITALQFDVTLPRDFSLDADGIELLSSRTASSHQLTVKELTDGRLRVMVTSQQSDPFSGNEGEIMALHVGMNGNVEDGMYDVLLTNVILADVTALTYYAPEACAQVEVKSYQKGDANGDGAVNVGDYVTTANYILELNPDPFIFSAADIDDNGAINVGDLVGIINIVLGANPSAAMHLAPMVGDIGMDGYVNKDGSHRTLTISLTNPMSLTAFQMDVTLPSGITLTDARLTDRAAISHGLRMVPLANGQLRLLASSAVNDVLTGTEGALLLIELEGAANNAGTIVDIDNVLLAERDMTLHAAGAMSIDLDMSSVYDLSSGVRIYARGNNVVVESPVDATVELTAPNGVTRTAAVKAGTNVYPAERGICIVRVAGQVAKLRL